MNLLDATANSVNTIFAQLIAKVGVRNVVAMARRLGITEPVGSQYFKEVCAITLGSVGFTPLEMADVYATFADGGVHHDPQAFETVRTANGKVLHSLSTKGTRVLSPNVAAQLTYALQGVVQHGTGTAAALGSRPVAGKTGTAENFQDAWFCGYVPQLATCVWVGYPRRRDPAVQRRGRRRGGRRNAAGRDLARLHGPGTRELAGGELPDADLNGGSIISGSGTYGYGYTTP